MNGVRWRLAAEWLSLALLLGSASSALAADFESRWPVDRRWVGPEYFANRLQDWRVEGGRLLCVEGREGFPLRTLHLLTRALAPGEGEFRLTVVTGAPDGGAGGEGWRGFLVGAGGAHVDYRLSALVHHRPAADGGLLALADETGLVAFRDNSSAPRKGGLWSIGGALDPAEAPTLPAEVRRTAAYSGRVEGPVELRLSGGLDGDGYVLRLSCHRVSDGQLLSEATLRGVPLAQVDGALALVSHRGSADGTSGFWFDDWRISGKKVLAHEERAFGPVLCAQHTLSRGVLKLTAQMGPLGPKDSRDARLEIRDGEEWCTVATARLQEPSSTFLFRVDNWDGSRGVEYRVVYELRTGEDSTLTCAYAGAIRPEPRDDPFVIAAFTGHKIYTGGLAWNHDGIWFPHQEVVDAVRVHDPDLLFFSGDQIYEGDLTPAQRGEEEKIFLDYLYKWSRFCWAFRDLMRDRVTVCIPDDHDVYHGNIWGAGGKRARRSGNISAQDSGGYKHSPWFVNAVHATQTSHLPDPFDPTPVGEGYSVYTTRLEYGGVSCAIIADRQWKSSATVAIPSGSVVNGWFQNPEFDPRAEADAPGASLLGEMQERFLDAWAVDWSGGAWMKVVLSQTLFANVATIPVEARSGSGIPGIPVLPAGEYPEDHKKAADTDSNGWPPSGRDRALRALRKGFALHICGDQHLASTVQYGIEAWRDGPFAMCVPSIANTWPRRWFPPEPGSNRRPGAPRYTGDFEDGFGNRVTVHAVANPHVSGREPARLHDRAPGYGIARLDRSTRRITLECWPRYEDPSRSGARPYPGWPAVLHQTEALSPGSWAWLPRLEIAGLDAPVIQVVDESGEVIQAIRCPAPTFQPRVRTPGSYTVKIGDPDADAWKSVSGVEAVAKPEDAGVLRVRIDVQRPERR